MKKLNSTRFMTQEELTGKYTALELAADSYPAAGLPFLVRDGKIYVDNEDSHTMVFGATGSKKTRNLVMPSVGIFARAGESFVVTDPKGEIFDRTSADVKAHDYNICCLNLREFANGIAWNPLALAYKYYHNGNRTKALEFVSEMMKMIIGEEATEETFWTYSAIDILMGFTLILFEEASEEECTLKNLCRLWNEYMANNRTVLNRIKEKYVNTLIYQKISYLYSPSDKTVGSMQTIVAMGINKLSLNEEFIEFVSRPGVDISTLVDGKQAIYLIVPDENTTYHFMVSLFLEQLYEVLIEKAQQESNHRLKNRMNFLIDEFANIPKIKNMDAMITASRSRNIRFQLIIQGMKQLRDKYGEVAEIITGNCNNWLYMYSKEFELLQDISNLCGEVFYDNSIRMPLFSTFELQHLNKEEGEALLLAGRNCPCLTNLADISQYPYPEGRAIRYPKVNELEAKKPKKRERSVSCFFIEPDVKKAVEVTPDWVEESKRWLVAVGPKGMIFAEEFATPKDIMLGTVAGRMACELQEKQGCETEYFEWYSAEERIGKKYHEILTENPEKIYLTITELGISNFSKEKEIAKNVRRLPDEHSYTISLSIQDGSLYSRRVQEVFNQKIPDFGGVTGLRYTYNVMFREANQKLKGTTFQNVPWEESTEAGRKTIYVKKLDQKAQAVLKLIK